MPWWSLYTMTGYKEYKQYHHDSYEAINEFGGSQTRGRQLQTTSNSSYYSQNVVSSFIKGIVKVAKFSKRHNEHGHYGFDGTGESTALDPKIYYIHG